MRAYGGAAGYRPRVQSAYYTRVYRHIWQASSIYIRQHLREFHSQKKAASAGGFSKMLSRMGLARPAHTLGIAFAIGFR